MKTEEIIKVLREEMKGIRYELVAIRKDLFKLNNKPKYEIGDIITKVNSDSSLVGTEIIDIDVKIAIICTRTNFIHHTQHEEYHYNYKVLKEDKKGFVETYESNIINVQSK